MAGQAALLGRDAVRSAISKVECTNVPKGKGDSKESMKTTNRK